MKKNNLFFLFMLCISTVLKNNTHSLDSIKNRNVQFVDFIFTDLNGNIRSVTLPIQKAEAAFKDGLKFDGSSIPGCSAITESDMHLQPDDNAFYILPENISVGKTALVPCNVCIDEKTPYSGCPRTFLKDVTQKLENLGFRLLVGPEIEFYLFKNGQLLDNQKYFDLEENQDLAQVKQAILQTLRNVGIDIEKIHHEVAPGQYEVSIRYNNALKMADQVVLTKHIIKKVAHQFGLKANFMPKPIATENGSGMHIHYSLFDFNNNKNGFYDEAGYHYLSETAKQFLAGNLKYINEISCLFNPSINSYKRLVPGFEAPIFVCWGPKNRSSMIRIPQINDGEGFAVRAELRIPDSSCNPYLAFSAIAATGLHGILAQEKIAEPVTKNIYKLSEAEIKELGIEMLPASLEQALNRFVNSNFAQEVFGSRLCSEFIKLKKKEIQAFNTCVTNWELENYA